jgi:nitroreductase
MNFKYLFDKYYLLLFISILPENKRCLHRAKLERYTGLNRYSKGESYHMSIVDILKTRRSIRNYKPIEIEDEKIEKLLEAATYAPNDRLREPWHFYVIRGEAKQRYEGVALEYLTERFPAKPHLVQESLKVLRNTPLLIVVTADIMTNDPASSTDNEYAACCAIHSMWLTAQELDLGMVWRTRGIGLVHDDRLYRFIGAPQNKKVVGNLFIGYPSSDSAPTNRTPYPDKTTWL